MERSRFVSALLDFVLPNILILVLLLPLSLFVAFIQTFVFVLLSQLYISEVSHPHDEHGEHDHAGDAPEMLAPALT